MKNSDKPICGVTTKQTGEPCERVAGWGTDSESGPCKYHRGTRPDGGNDGGAPANNGNAVKHNQRADKSKLWERMPDSRKQLWQEIRQAQIERHKERHGTEPNSEDINAYEDRAWSAILKQYARDRMAECMEETGNPLIEKVTRTVDGETVTFERPNQVLSEVTDNRREDRLSAKDRGLLEDDGAESQAAKELGEIARQALED
jgi:hypothetical protein